MQRPHSGFRTAAHSATWQTAPACLGSCSCHQVFLRHKRLSDCLMLRLLCMQGACCLTTCRRPSQVSVRLFQAKNSPVCRTPAVRQHNTCPASCMRPRHKAQELQRCLQVKACNDAVCSLMLSLKLCAGRLLSDNTPQARDAARQLAPLIHQAFEARSRCALVADLACLA